MSDTTSEHDDLSTTQEYTIAGVVILFFGILYWLFNYGFPDINFNTNGTQPATALVSDNNQAISQQQTSTGLDKSADKATSAEANAPDQSTAADTDSSKQQFVTKQANTDTKLTQPSTDSSADNAANATSGKATGSTAQSEDSAVNAAGKMVQNTNSENTDTANTNTQTIVSTGCNATAGQEAQADTSTAANSLAQRVITDPAVLKLRDHLLNGELEKPVLMDSVSFADKSAVAELSADTQVLDLAALMLQNPKTKILIRGHTANEGSAAESKQLSLARATALGQKLVAACAAGHNIIIMSMGDADPLLKDNNQQNRGRNRRIDVAITQ